MKVEAERGGVVEDDAPLVELRAVVVEFVFALREGPDVVTITARVVGEEGEGIDAFAREVVQRPDESFAFAVFPSGIARLPVLHMRFPGLERDFVRLARAGVVEVRVSQQRLGSVWASFQEILLRPGELEVMFANILQATVSAEIAILLICLRDREAAGDTIEGLQCLTATFDCRVFAFGETHGVSPYPDFVG